MTDIEQAVRAGISIGREQMRDKVVGFIMDWADTAVHPTEATRVLHDVAGEIENWETA